MLNWVRWWLLAALCWWLLLLPKQYALFDSVRTPFQQLGQSLVNFLFGTQVFYEDTRGMYLLLIISPLLALPFGFLCRINFLSKGKIQPWLAFHPLQIACSIMRWFLVLELFQYGWIKVTKMQFYLPEPNTVYTAFGELSQDIAWWSVAGSSPSYVIFMGSIELLSGILILIRRTRFAGLMLALGIFCQVVIINVSFDISVKLFSITLLLMTALLLLGYPHTWRAIFQLPSNDVLQQQTPTSRLRVWTRALLVALVVSETLYPSIQTGNWNDDKQPRPPYHGAYIVRNKSPFKHIFVHRRGYLILQNKKGEMYSLRIQSMSDCWVLKDEQTGEISTFRILRKNKTYLISWKGNGFVYHLILKRLPYRSLPLFQSSFHWFSDDYH